MKKKKILNYEEYRSYCLLNELTVSNFLSLIAYKNYVLKERYNYVQS